jgi:hypothetical protein
MYKCSMRRPFMDVQMFRCFVLFHVIHEKLIESAIDPKLRERLIFIINQQHERHDAKKISISRQQLLLWVFLYRCCLVFIKNISRREMRNAREDGKSVFEKTQANFLHALHFPSCWLSSVCTDNYSEIFILPTSTIISSRQIFYVASPW